MRTSFAFAARRVAARVAVSSVASAQAGFMCSPSAGTAGPMAVVAGSLCQHRFNMTRPGDWTCGGCGFSNFGSRAVCKNCASPRPSPAGAGGASAAGAAATEWRCPSCQLSNPADVAYCVACSFAKPSAVPSPGTGGGDMEGRTAASLDAKPGDWLCSKCAFHNFRRNATCRQCGSPKPDGPPTMSRGNAPAAAGGAAGGPSTFMKGDWTCVGCGDHNFAKRTTCRACGAERVKLSNPDGKKTSTVMANDWNCPSCAVNNFARRTECFKCGTAKPAGASSNAAAE